MANIATTMGGDVAAQVTTLSNPVLLTQTIIACSLGGLTILFQYGLSSGYRKGRENALATAFLSFLFVSTWVLYYSATYFNYGFWTTPTSAADVDPANDIDTLMWAFVPVAISMMFYSFSFARRAGTSNGNYSPANHPSDGKLHAPPPDAYWMGGLALFTNLSLALGLYDNGMALFFGLVALFFALMYLVALGRLYYQLTGVMDKVQSDPEAFTNYYRQTWFIFAHFILYAYYIVVFAVSPNASNAVSTQNSYIMLMVGVFVTILFLTLEWFLFDVKVQPGGQSTFNHSRYSGQPGGGNFAVAPRQSQSPAAGGQMRGSALPVVKRTPMFNNPTSQSSFVR